ncbi:Hypothetical protein I596_781 [Dokdonella koreensis DS-123]|uniref:Uncharacterized protein n=1 Tax=Dokdonella koreensis DS-123 TaxID=1300342 RepID=A0A160DRM0_9GAMM|nr:Hypothetical protein I596_781 [Dokdonella koreensis DS-123]
MGHEGGAEQETDGEKQALREHGGFRRERRSPEDRGFV